MSKKQITIGIGGVATAGKDTFFSLLRKRLPKKVITRYAFADNLKKEVAPMIAQHFGLDVWNLNPADKAIVRPFLVWWGCTKRHFQPDYWIKNLEGSLFNDNTSDIKVVTDVRFQNEALWISGMIGGKVIHIKRCYPDKSAVPPANAEETANDPLVLNLSSSSFTWETMLPESIDNLNPYIDRVIKLYDLDL